MVPKCWISGVLEELLGMHEKLGSPDERKLYQIHLKLIKTVYSHVDFEASTRMINILD